MRRFVAGMLWVALSISLAPPVAAERRAEYRAFWVDTFNTPLNTPEDVHTIVKHAREANANAIFAQVRRRGDAWYRNSLEPLPDFAPITRGFDPLQEMIETAHAQGIEVHAFVIIGAVWNKNPNFEPAEKLGPPTSPDHLFNRHGGYDPRTQKIRPGPDNWLTRTLLPDGGSISFQGHRFGNDFWLDLGHPDAAAYTLEVLMHLVRNYDIDGLHLDRIRYPEFTGAAQSAETGANIGYNATSVARFKRRYGLRGSKLPAPNDPRWSQWRRDQVTNFVRRVYLNAIAIKPELKVSAALVAYGGGPNSEEEWKEAEPYWRVFQDWRAWTEEGIVDLAIPMTYKGEHLPVTALQFHQWNEWTKTHQYGRAALIGIGGFVNALEGSLRQTRKALAPSANGLTAAGVIFFSMARSNAALRRNPYTRPPSRTPRRTLSEFADGLTSGSMPVFAQPAAIPALPWKVTPSRGHLIGFARHADGSPMDSAAVTIRCLGTPPARKTITDGQGFFGGVDLEPGQYIVEVRLGSEHYVSKPVTVTAGLVSVTE